MPAHPARAAAGEKSAPRGRPAPPRLPHRPGRNHELLYPTLIAAAQNSEGSGLAPVGALGPQSNTDALAWSDGKAFVFKIL